MLSHISILGKMEVSIICIDPEYKPVATRVLYHQ